MAAAFLPAPAPSLPNANCSISRKISSPSRPASQALGQLHHRVQPRLGLVHRLEVEVRRNHRQVGEAPLAALHVELLGRMDLHQVADGAGDDVRVVLEELVVLVEFAGDGRQRPDDVLGDRGLFGNNQCLCHGPLTRCLAAIASLMFLQSALSHARVRACAHARTCTNPN
jgi:hypothetical protein